MKIALVHKRYDRFGGAEWDCYELSRRFQQMGHLVVVVAGEFRIPAPAGVIAMRVPLVRTGRLAKLLSFAFFAPRVWRSLGADVTIGFGNTVGEDLYRCSGGLHSHYLKLLARASSPLRRARNCLSLTQRATLAIERAKLRTDGHRKILAVSELTRREILQECELPDERIAVVHYGVDRHRFNPGNRKLFRMRIRGQLGLDETIPLVLFVGSGFRRKGVDVLLEAWRHGPPRGAALVVVGADARLKLLAARARRGGFGRVVFTGPVAEVEQFYAAADLFVLPSLWEGCPVVMLEAMASGLPVVVPARTGAPELVKGCLAQLLLEDAWDAEEVREKIAVALEPGLNEQLKREASSLGAGLNIEESTRAIEKWCRWVAEN